MRLLDKYKNARPLKFSLGKVRRVHMVGIKGTGMSALAINLKQMGIKVSGSDFAESFFTDDILAKHNIKVMSPFNSNNIAKNADLVIVSTAYNNKNIEVQEANRRGLPIMLYPEVLGLLTKQLPSIAVCGSHGKTTTSGVVSYILSKTKYRPIVNVGSIVPQLVNYKARNPKLFVFEADEYQNKFQYFFPKIVILTNIDYDHPDYFKNAAHYKSVFHEFVKKIPYSGLLIYCADDKNCRDVVKSAKCKKISYGFSKYANFELGIPKIMPQKMIFEVKSLGRFESKLLGKHNVLNLGATIICANFLKIPVTQIKKHIASFNGTKRRLEITKHIKINSYDCIVIDDFGHHPTEIKATIATIKAAYPNKTLWTVFQPHTFSRTRALLDNFVTCFAKSDKTIILDIYASKREIAGPPKFSYGKPRRVNKIHSGDLVKKMKGYAYYQPDIKKAAAFLKKKINSNSIILTIGASEVWRLAELL